ncbi:MAG: TetR/AcrR family transcriptional regulator [Gammaproteobacteria bacterium]|nr:TetR/AcrR family transcriptional regulator [Gammaproteobacteria bacterium]
MTTRDRQKTRMRILDAASKEFARLGFAGARIDEVAQVAKVNKRMIYHYFQSKNGLYTAVLDSRLGDQGLEGDATTVLDALHGGFDLEVLRLMTWEALTGGTDDNVAEPRRSLAWQRLLSAVVVEQETGVLRTDLDPRQLTLALLAIRIFPRIFSRYSKVILAEDAHARDFASGLDEFFKLLLGALRPGGNENEHKPRIRLKPTSTPST